MATPSSPNAKASSFKQAPKSSILKFGLNKQQGNSGWGGGASKTSNSKLYQAAGEGGGGGGEGDGLDSLIQETLDQQEDTAALSDRLAQRVAETEQIAAAGLNQLNAQGEKLTNIDSRMDELDGQISTATKDAKYLKKLTGHFMIPVLPSGASPKLLDAKQISKLQFASKAPKDKKGVPIATPRGASLAIQFVPAPNTDESPSTRTSRTSRSSISSSDFRISLDESATAEQKQRSKDAEQVLQQNMGYVSKGVGNLKMAALSMSNEMDKQNEQLDQLNTRTGNTANAIDSLNSTVFSMLKKKKK